MNLHHLRPRAGSCGAALPTFGALGQRYDIARPLDALADVADHIGSLAAEGEAFRKRTDDLPRAPARAASRAKYFRFDTGAEQIVGDGDQALSQSGPPHARSSGNHTVTDRLIRNSRRGEGQIQGSLDVDQTFR